MFLFRHGSGMAKTLLHQIMIVLNESRFLCSKKRLKFSGRKFPLMNLVLSQLYKQTIIIPWDTSEYLLKNAIRIFRLALATLNLTLRTTHISLNRHYLLWILMQTSSELVGDSYLSKLNLITYFYISFDTAFSAVITRIRLSRCNVLEYVLDWILLNPCWYFISLVFKCHLQSSFRFRPNNNIRKRKNLNNLAHECCMPISMN